MSDLDMDTMMREMALVHFKQDCYGLPLCASCRATVLIQNDFHISKCEKFIESQPKGTKVYLAYETREEFEQRLHNYINNQNLTEGL